MTHRLTAHQFSQFFQELRQADHAEGKGFPPYPWQQRLCEQVLTDGWSPYINLPTGAGKTSVLEIAVFALACEAAIPWQERKSSTRIFFVIDRRIVVDEADRKARKLAEHLQMALNDGAFATKFPLIATVAKALSTIACSDRHRSDSPTPLEVHSLRGGFYRTNEWAQSLVQPTIVTSTVDQIGSRLLFRGYGLSPNARPLQAALVGHDSLIFLDEAHTAAAMASTVDSIRQYQALAQRTSESSGETLITRPLNLVQMTATLPSGVTSAPNGEGSEEPPQLPPSIFRLDPERDLADESLPFVRAYRRSKPVTISQATASGKNASKQLAKVLAARVQSRLEQCASATEATDEPHSQPAIAIVVNRVATARELYAQLGDLKKLDFDRCLMIGQMRPIDRDQLGRSLGEKIGTGKTRSLEKPLVVVATQCLEVGADLDFDWMISEAASIDALRQRFGRLNRAGRLAPEKPSDWGSGEIVIRSDQELDEKKIEGLNVAADADPIYGFSLARTYRWLQSLATPQEDKSTSVDFGLSAMDQEWNALPRETRGGADSLGFSQDPLLIERPQTAVLMPAHLDLLSQTYQVRRDVPQRNARRGQSDGSSASSTDRDSLTNQVAPDPDVSLYLHGRQQRPTDVSVCWRSDLCDVVFDSDKTKKVHFVSLNDPRLSGDSDPLSSSSSERMVTTVSELPPSSAECMSVGWRAIRQFLSGLEVVDDADQSMMSDNDTFGKKEDKDYGRIPKERQPVVWRGPDQSFVGEFIRQIRPGDTLVFPTSAGGWSVLGNIPDITVDPAQNPANPVDEKDRNELITVDVADAAYLASHWKPILRTITWANNASANKLSSSAIDESISPEDIATWLTSVRSNVSPWSRRLIDALLKDLAGTTVQPRLSQTGEIVYFSRKRLERTEVLDLLADSRSVSAQPEMEFTDTTSVKSDRSVLLADHSASVSERAGEIAEALGLVQWKERFTTAGLLHDLGKADSRFQSTLWGASASESWLMRKLFAKSKGLATSSRGRKRDRERSQLPPGFRHELVSSHLAQQIDPELDSVTLHLIESHHGYARPWFPTWRDENPPAIDLQSLGIDCVLPSDARNEASESHGRLQAAERFWEIQNRLGVWQTAFLESILRIADQQISREEELLAKETTPAVAEFPHVKTLSGQDESPLWRKELLGLDGSNPLAFLATLGLLRLLDEELAAATLKMHWEVQGGSWVPVLTSRSPAISDAWFELSLERLAERTHLSVMEEIDEGNGKIIASPQVFGNASEKSLRKFIRGEVGRSSCDFLTALSSEMSRRIELKKETDVLEYSELYMTRGSGHQRMLELARNVRQATTLKHLRESILEPWKYDDPGKSLNLRWDPLDDRQYAKRWLNPSNDPNQTVWGANDLAFEALPIFTTAIVRGRLETTAFHRIPRKGTYFSWPIWTSPISFCVIKSLLQHSEWQSSSLDETTASLLSVSHVRQVQRVRNDKFFNFSLSTTMGS